MPNYNPDFPKLHSGETLPETDETPYYMGNFPVGRVDQGNAQFVPADSYTAYIYQWYPHQPPTRPIRPMKGMAFIDYGPGIFATTPYIFSGIRSPYMMEVNPEWPNGIPDPSAGCALAPYIDDDGNIRMSGSSVKRGQPLRSAAWDYINPPP
jgi:hypothetical protein